MARDAVIYSKENPKGKVTAMPDHPKGSVIFKHDPKEAKVKAVTK